MRRSVAPVSEQLANSLVPGACSQIKLAADAGTLAASASQVPVGPRLPLQRQQAHIAALPSSSPAQGMVSPHAPDAHSPRPCAESLLNVVPNILATMSGTGVTSVQGGQQPFVAALVACCLQSLPPVSAEDLRHVIARHFQPTSQQPALDCATFLPWQVRPEAAANCWRPLCHMPAHSGLH